MKAAGEDVYGMVKKRKVSLKKKTSMSSKGIKRDEKALFRPVKGGKKKKEVSSERESYFVKGT